MTDDLDALLAPRPAPADPAAKEALFRRTARTLAWRRRLRRAAAGGLVGLVFAAGGGLGWSAKPAPPPAPPPPEPVPVVVPVPIPVPVPAGGSPGEVPPLTAAALELEAEKATDRATSARLYRLAGDKYLAELNDIPAAARCYTLHLAEAGPTGLAVAADDSWLLIRMKTSREREGGNEPRTGT